MYLCWSYFGLGVGDQGGAGDRALCIRAVAPRRLICLIDREHQASINVAMKIGMTFEKEGEDEMGPFLVYSRSKES